MNYAYNNSLAILNSFFSDSLLFSLNLSVLLNLFDTLVFSFSLYYV